MIVEKIRTELISTMNPNYPWAVAYVIGAYVIATIHLWMYVNEHQKEGHKNEHV